MAFRGIALNGKQGSGKTSTGQALGEHLLAQGHKNVAYLRFAGPLKVVTVKMMESIPGSLTQDAWDSLLREDWKYRFRPALQALGAGLREFDPDVWVNLLIAQVNSLPQDTVIIVDDLRYRNEALALAQAGFFLARLDADEESRGARVTLSGTEHSSETALDGFAGFHLRVDSTKFDGGQGPARAILGAIHDQETTLAGRPVLLPAAV